MIMWFVFISNNLSFCLQNLHCCKFKRSNSQTYDIYSSFSNLKIFDNIYLILIMNILSCLNAKDHLRCSSFWFCIWNFLYWARRHGQVCLINPNVLGAVLPRTAISAWAPRKLGLILMTVGVCLCLMLPES